MHNSYIVFVTVSECVCISNWGQTGSYMGAAKRGTRSYEAQCFHYLQAEVERMIVIIISSEIQRDKRNQDEGKEEPNKNNYLLFNFVSKAK